MPYPMSFQASQPGPNEPDPQMPDPTKHDPIDPPRPASPPEEFPSREPNQYPIHPDIPEQPIHEPTPQRPIA